MSACVLLIAHKKQDRYGMVGDSIYHYQSEQFFSFVTNSWVGAMEVMRMPLVVLHIRLHQVTSYHEYTDACYSL